MFARLRFNNKAIVVCATLAASLQNGCMRTVTHGRFCGAGLVEHSGYSDCIELKNEAARVVLGPACGGRVLEYSLNGRNCLYLDPRQNGWVYEPPKGTIDPSGGRFDIGPENTIPSHPDLWLGKWKGQITGPRSARLVSVEDKATGVQLVREFTLDKSSSRLTCRQTIKNISNETRHWCHWSRTLADGGGICLIPLTPNSRFPNKYAMYEQGPLINYRPQDPNVGIRDGFLEVVGTPKYPKLGVDSYAGWLCYLCRSNLMLVKRFPTYPYRVYGEIAAITISIWYYKDIMCELEPIGPRETIAPGRSASFSEEWWLLPYEFPGRGGHANLGQVVQVVADRAR